MPLTPKERTNKQRKKRIADSHMEENRKVFEVFLKGQTASGPQNTREETEID